MFLHYMGLKCKSRVSRNTWLIWPWSTEWSKAKANRVLARECTGHTKTPSSNNKRELYTWTSPDGQYRNQNDYIICSWWWSSIQSAKTRLGADCDIDHEILIAKCRHKLKKVGKINRSCRYAAKSLQSCSTLCDPIDGSPPNSTIPGIL